MGGFTVGINWRGASGPAGRKIRWLLWNKRDAKKASRKNEASKLNKKFYKRWWRLLCMY